MRERIPYFKNDLNLTFATGFTGYFLCRTLTKLPRRGAGHPGAGPGGVGHQHLAQGGEGTQEVPGQLGQILNHQLQSPEVRRKVLIVTTVGETQLGP